MNEVVADIGLEHAVGGKGAWGLRDQHRLDPELLGKEDRMHWSRPAERHERELPRVEATPDSDLPDQRRHPGIDDFEGAFGEAVLVESKGSSEPAQRVGRPIRMQGHAAAEEVTRVDPAQMHVGVGYRGLDAASAVARRAWFRTRAARPDAQAARRLPRDRPAPRPDRF